MGSFFFCLILVSAFLLGRYGWKLGGFGACQSAGVAEVTVKEGQVNIKGFYPGSFPEGFVGYYAEEKDGKLYVGYKFSALLGIFESGDFDITIPTHGKIDEVYTKTRMKEELIWSANGKRPYDEEYGVFVRLEPNEAYSIEISFAGKSYSCDMESGEFFYINTDIDQIAKEKNAPVDFMIQVKTAQGEVAAAGNFTYDAVCTQIFLSVTEDGRIVECNSDGAYKEEKQE